MFEYDDQDEEQEIISEHFEEEQVVLPKPKPKTKSKSKSKPEPQPESESETSSESDSKTNVKQEKFMDGSNFNNFVDEQHQDQMYAHKDEQEEEQMVLSADDIEELRELLKNWLELDEANKELSDRIKDIKMEKKQYESYILGFMDKTKKEIIKASDSNLVLRKEVKETRAKPNEENILKVLTRVLGDATQAYKFTQEIIEDAPIKETISLKKDSAKPKKTNQPKRTTKRVKKDI